MLRGTGCRHSAAVGVKFSRRFDKNHHHHHHHPRCYNPCRVLTDSIISLHPSLSMAFALQFLIPSLPASLFTASIHLRLGLPTLLLPSGIPRVIFLHGRLSCIRQKSLSSISGLINLKVTLINALNYNTRRR